MKSSKKKKKKKWDEKLLVGIQNTLHSEINIYPGFDLSLMRANNMRQESYIYMYT